MKALIRSKGETVTEVNGPAFIDWSTGYPLTNPKWFGGPYTLVHNYIPEIENDLDFIREVAEQHAEEPQEEVIENENDYVIIDGKRYSKEELRSLLE